MIKFARGTGKNWLRLLALQYKLENKSKEKTMGTQKNNIAECHERGLQKRINKYNTQQTIRTMDSSPAIIEFERKQKFFLNTMLMLSGYKKIA